MSSLCAYRVAAAALATAAETRAIRAALSDGTVPMQHLGILCISFDMLCWVLRMCLTPTHNSLARTAGAFFAEQMP